MADLTQFIAPFVAVVVYAIVLFAIDRKKFEN